MKCNYIKSDGTQCNSYAMKDKPFCLAHQRSQQKTNKNIRRGIVIKKPKFNISTVEDIPKVLISLINQIHGDVIESKKGSTIGYLTNILLKSFEVTDLEKRLTRIEGILSDVYVSGDIDSILQEIHGKRDGDEGLTDEDYDDDDFENKTGPYPQPGENNDAATEDSKHPEAQLHETQNDDSRNEELEPSGTEE